MSKTFLKSRTNNIHRSPLIHHTRHLFVKGYRVGQALFPLYKAMLITHHHLLSLMCLEVISNRICSITFPWKQKQLTSLQFPGRSSLPFLKSGMTFAVHQSSGTSPDHMVITDFSKVFDQSSSLSTHGCIPSDPMDLHMSSLNIP